MAQTIGIVGLGLIGGSMAKAIKANTDDRVLACDLDKAVLDAALRDGAADEAASARKLAAGSDIVFVALFPEAAVDYITRHAGDFRPGTIVCDLCGVKRVIQRNCADRLAERGVRYVGGHPMAGKEFSGYAYSDPAMFRDASFILATDKADPEAVETLEQYLLRLGFGRVTKTTAKQHDRVIAFTSQLAHVVSGAYVKSPAADDFFGFSAGSFKDLTRVAKLDPDMWTELFLLNAHPLCQEIDILIRHLEEYRRAIGDGDADRLRALLEEGSERKIACNERERQDREA